MADMFSRKTSLSYLQLSGIKRFFTEAALSMGAALAKASFLVVFHIKDSNTE
ncbi:hypothetical protein [Rufibacter sp. LB8]|uniref:hypothetical protein n=1 Tax=Rufibacter sp. LB8 TaxID=2777781 RepID=UPI00178C6800|nr:hypothetical protein [Rufibacter sp. LB8]